MELLCRWHDNLSAKGSTNVPARPIVWLIVTQMQPCAVLGSNFWCLQAEEISLEPKKGSLCWRDRWTFTVAALYNILDMSHLQKNVAARPSPAAKSSGDKRLVCSCAEVLEAFKTRQPEGWIVLLTMSKRRNRKQSAAEDTFWVRMNEYRVCNMFIIKRPHE